MKKLDLDLLMSILRKGRSEDRSELQLMARAVNRLEEVKLCRLTSKQAEAILKQSLIHTSLKK